MHICQDAQSEQCNQTALIKVEISEENQSL